MFPAEFFNLLWCKWYNKIGLGDSPSALMQIPTCAQKKSNYAHTPVHVTCCTEPQQTTAQEIQILLMSFFRAGRITCTHICKQSSCQGTKGSVCGLCDSAPHTSHKHLKQQTTENQMSICQAKSTRRATEEEKQRKEGEKQRDKGRQRERVRARERRIPLSSPPTIAHVSQ